METENPKQREDKPPPNDIWEHVLYGDGKLLHDCLGRLIYDSKWFLGEPSIDELLHQDVRGTGVGYNVPKFHSKGIIKLWWSVSDQECEEDAAWAKISVSDLLVWLMRLGFTGRSFEPLEWSRR